MNITEFSIQKGSLQRSLQHLFFSSLYLFVVIYDRLSVALTAHLFARIIYVGFIMISLSLEENRGFFTGFKKPLQGFQRFKRPVVLIMENDALSFVALCIVSRNSFETDFPQRLVLYTAGLIFILVGVGIKMWAARILQRGYYWWDFFDRSQGTQFRKIGPYRYLKNPMYTVGYAHAYGFALLTVSVPGLIVALFDQMLIYLFYLLIEKPHIERRYQNRNFS